MEFVFIFLATIATFVGAIMSLYHGEYFNSPKGREDTVVDNNYTPVVETNY